MLEGQSIASGHLALSGWSLSYDSFWTLDAPFFALIGGVFGIGQYLMWLVPAVIATLLVVTALWLARVGGRDLGGLLGAGVVVTMLALPSPELSFFLLQAGWHAATVLFCLLAFAGVRSRSSRGFVGAVLAVAAALLGDLLALPLAVLPLVIGGLIAIGYERSRRAGARQLGAALGGTLLALVVRALAFAAGTYSISSRSALAPPHQMITNLASIPGRLAGLGGLGSFVSSVPSQPLVLRVGRFVLLGLALWALIEALGGLLRVVRPVRRRRAAIKEAQGAPRRQSAFSERYAVDDLLALGVLGSLVSYVLFATENAVNFGRYLLPAYLFGVVLAARAVARLFHGRARFSAPVVTSVALAVLLLCGVDFATGSLGVAAPQSARQLAAFLSAHDLRNGVGDYWSSSIVTVDTGGQVSVRPVNLSKSGTLVRYNRQSSADWYSGQRFNFFVYDSSAIWQGVDASSARRTFGPPTRTYAVGGYRVLVYSRPVQVSSALLAQTSS